MAARDGAGERRRTRSLDERKRIVEEALAPGVSVAAVARRHGLNANLIFKWIGTVRLTGVSGGSSAAAVSVRTSTRSSIDGLVSAACT